MADEVDIIENNLLMEHTDVLQRLLCDHTTQKNIFWATDSYADLGDGYQWHDPITIESITGEHGTVLQPRAVKSREEQIRRSKDKAEVFTEPWICNKQANATDALWFGRDDVFNHVKPDNTWTSTTEKIKFPEGKTWIDYVKQNALEITCGEAPYLVSRYDTVMGHPIPVSQRIGLLDRKLRVVSENTESYEEWFQMAKEAYKATYGFEWQGDSLLLAREALFYTFIDYHQDKFQEAIAQEDLNAVADIISWNIWQMDGLKCVVPDSCHDTVSRIVNLDGTVTEQRTPCTGCNKGTMRNHNGIYCRIMDWENSTSVRFVDLLKGVK